MNDKKMMFRTQSRAMQYKMHFVIHTSVTYLTGSIIIISVHQLPPSSVQLLMALETTDHNSGR